ncbi:unnamed protein product, partial [Tilletia laevis]
GSASEFSDTHQLKVTTRQAADPVVTPNTRNSTRVASNTQAACSATMQLPTRASPTGIHLQRHFSTRLATSDSGPAT